jgi:diaminopimelate epimerase
MTNPGGGRLRFQKGSALGNDYIVIDATELGFELTPSRARLLCDRHEGVGSDGILLTTIRGASDLSPGFNLRIINPDGSEAEKSGNGLRIFAAFLHRWGLVGDRPFNVVLPRDTVSMRVLGALTNGVLDVEVEMGRAAFGARAVAWTGTPDDTIASDYSIPLADGLRAAPVFVSVGNPHTVIFVDALDRADFVTRAPLICTHASFGNGTNVQFARVVNENEIEAWIWERGAGETMASGSSASAVASAAVYSGRVKPGSFEVVMPGGTAHVKVSEQYDITLRGPAQILYEGVVSESLMDALTSVS